jgi:hypothetical protein
VFGGVCVGWCPVWARSSPVPARTPVFSSLSLSFICRSLVQFPALVGGFAAGGWVLWFMVIVLLIARCMRGDRVQPVSAACHHKQAM